MNDISTVMAWDDDELAEYAKVLVVPDGKVHLAAPEGDGWSPLTMCRRGRHGGPAPRRWESFASVDADDYCGGCPMVDAPHVDVSDEVLERFDQMLGPATLAPSATVRDRPEATDGRSLH